MKQWGILGYDLMGRLWNLRNENLSEEKFSRVFYWALVGNVRKDGKNVCTVFGQADHFILYGAHWPDLRLNFVKAASRSVLDITTQGCCISSFLLFPAKLMR